MNLIFDIITKGIDLLSCLLFVRSFIFCPRPIVDGCLRSFVPTTSQFSFVFLQGEDR